MKIKLFILVVALVLNFQASVSFSKDKSAILKVFEKYNNCRTDICAFQFLEGVMLKQMKSVDSRKRTKIIEQLKLSVFSTKTEIKGTYGALTVKNYKYAARPELTKRDPVIYLFVKRGKNWKLYHRLQPNQVSSKLRPKGK